MSKSLKIIKFKISNYFLYYSRFNSKYYIITVVKYSVTFLSGKIENLEPIVNDLENQVINVRICFL